MSPAKPIGILALAALLVACPLAGGSEAAVLAPARTDHGAAASQAPAAEPIETVQYRRGWGGAPRGYYVPRPYAYGPPRYYGGPAWGYRPWYRRPYYGTIVGGIALGAIIGATAYGLAPRPPRPDLCWYWADEIQSQGYWDYC